VGFLMGVQTMDQRLLVCARERLPADRVDLLWRSSQAVTSLNGETGRRASTSIDWSGWRKRAHWGPAEMVLRHSRPSLQR